MRQILPANDPSVEPVNPYELREHDIAIIVDTPAGAGVLGGKIEFDGDRISDISQGPVAHSHAVYVVAVFGNQLHDAPLKVPRGGVVRAFTFGDKIQLWLAENNDIRAETLRRQIRALGTDIARMIEDATQIHHSQQNTLH